MNKKLTKLLSVFLIAGLIGAGTAVGVAGCKKDNGGGGTNNNVTEQDITWNMKGHGTKPSNAAAKTSGGKVTKPTDPTDPDYNFGGWYEDDACTTPFDFTKVYTSAVTVYAKWTLKTQAGAGINLSKEWVKADYDAAADNSGKKYLEADSEIMDGVYIGDTDLEIESNSKKIIYDGAEKSVGYRVKFGGELFEEKTEGVKTPKRSIKVEVEEDATLVVYGTAGTSNKTAYISLAEGTTTEGATTLTIVDTQQICWLNGDMNAVIFELEAGKTYYFGSDTVTAGDDNASNANIYYMEIKSDFDEGLGEKVNEKGADCENKGVAIAHYYTKYGRYLDATTKEVLNPNEVFEDALGHKWTYTTVTAPTADNAGSVTLTCANDNTHTVPVILPALKTPGIYERKDITDGADAGKVEYSFAYANVYEGTTKVDAIKFIAEKVAETQVDFVDITGIVCEEGEGDYIQSANATPKPVGNGTLKLTAATNNGGEMGSSKSLNVEFADGKVNMVDTETSNILYGILGFDAPKTSGVYRVTGKLNAVDAGNWDPVQIVSDASITADSMDSKILFALSSGANKKYCMRFDGVRRTESAFAVNTSDKYFFRLDVDLDNHIATISLSLDGEEWATIDSVTDPSINTFAGIRFQTGSGSRSFSVEQIAVAQQMEVTEVAAAGDYEMIEGQYDYGTLSYVKTDDSTLKINRNGTFTFKSGGQSSNGTWTEGDGYFECTMPNPVQAGQNMTMYAVYDETNEAVFLYMAEEHIALGQYMMVFVKKDTDVKTALSEKLEDDGFGAVEAGKSQNPIVLTLSETAVTKTVGTEVVFYQYKNTTAEEIQVTVVVGANTAMGYGFTTNSATSITEKKVITIAAGQTLYLVVNTQDAQAGEINFTFRNYKSEDGAAAINVTFDFKGHGEDSNYMVEANGEGKLASLPNPTDDSGLWRFDGWFLDDGVWEEQVTTDTVFTETTTIYAKWTAIGTTIAEQTNSYSYSAIPEQETKTNVNQSAFDGTQNAWLTVVNESDNYVYYRSPSDNSRIELNNGGLKVYYGAAGTLSISVKSTGGSNDSLIGLKNASGAYIAATSAGGATAATAGAEVLGSSANVQLSASAVGAYIVHGSEEKTLTFTINDAGWYTIYSDRSETTRGIVVTAISRTVDEYTVGAVAATEITLSDETLTIDEQDSETVTATITKADDVYIKEIGWSSEDPTAVKVEDGVITVLKKGTSDTVLITLSVTDSLNRTVTKTVTVTVNHVGATGVNITTAADSTLKVGDHKQLEYEVTTDGGEATDVKTVTWDSSNKAVATVDDKGEVTVVGAGTTDITVKITTLTSDEGFTSAPYTITIEAKKATEITSVAAVSVKVGRTAQISPVVGPEGASGYTLSYAVTAGDTFASVDASTGVVTGIAAGTATVTVTLNDGDSDVDTKTCTVTVSDPTSTPYTYNQGDSLSGDNWSGYGSPTTNTSQDSPALTGLKIENNKGLQLTATGFKATITVSGFTTASSNSVTLKIQAVDAQGNVLKEIAVNSTKSKTNGSFYGSSESDTTFVLEMDAGVEFTAIKFVIGSNHSSITTTTITVLS